MQKSRDFSQEANQQEWYCFKNSRWGRLYDTIPWDELETCLPAISRGPTPYFDRKGKFALMFPRGVRSNMNSVYPMKP